MRSADTQYFGSFAKENLEQAKCINSKFQQQSQVILMGDVECGPEIPSAMPSILGEHERKLADYNVANN